MDVILKECELELAMPPDDAFEMCLEVIAALRFSGKPQCDRLKRSIKFRTKLTKKSWGETMSFLITEIDTNLTKISISSKPLVSTTIFDYGKNEENLHLFTAAIREAEKEYLQKNLIE